MAYTIAGNASGWQGVTRTNRKITKLSNGWLVSVVPDAGGGALSPRIYRSTDDGVTWTFMGKVVGSGSPSNSYYESTTSITSSGNTVYILSFSVMTHTLTLFVKDMTTWTAGTDITNAGLSVGTSYDNTWVHSVKVSANGDIHVYYSVYNGDITQWYYTRSEDNGVGPFWASGANHRIHISDSSNGSINSGELLFDNSGYPIVVVMQNSGLRLYAATSARPTSSSHWASRSFLNNTYPVTMGGSGVNLVSFVRNPANGYLYCVYHCRFVTPGNTNNYYAKMSTDNGVTWSAEVLIASYTQLDHTNSISATIDNLGRLWVIYNWTNTAGTASVSVASSEPNGISTWTVQRTYAGVVSPNFIYHYPSMMYSDSEATTGKIRWQYLFNGGLAGISYDDYVLNTAPNAPTITYPQHTFWINTRTPTMTWNFSDPDAGNTQSAYLVELVNSAYNAVLKTTGWVASSASSFTLPSDWITADGTYYLRMQVKDGSGTINSPSTTPAVGDQSYSNTFFGVDTVNPTGSATGANTRYLNAANKADSFTVNAADNVDLVGVNFAVWGDSGGQDDIVWYPGTNNGNGTWSKTINFAVHDSGIDQHYNVHVYAYDSAGNSANIATYNVYIDTVVPAAPTQNNGTLYATTNGVSWSAFSDGASSSGRKTTALHLQTWNGSTWNNVAGFPIADVGAVSSYSFTGLAPGTQYRWGIVYTDNSNNANTLTYTTFTTNSYAVSTIVNLASAGSTLNQKPAIKFTVTDANDATLTNFQIQVSSVNTFASTVLDTTSGAASAGWSHTSAASGTTIKYTPQTNIAAGVWYVRTRAYDGKDWGTWSTTINFTIAAASWPTTISDADTAVSKRTIDSLRTAVNAARQARGLATVPWTDPTITDWTGAGTQIRAVHLTELRQAITDIFTALGNTAPTWTDSSIVASSTQRKGKHWSEMRTALLTA